MKDQAFVDEEILKRVPRWRDYLAAKLGFRNHWYPVILSREVAEGEVKKAKVCGEDIILKRIDGKIHAMRDRCIHRGVALSEKVECYTKNTISCWYHGFTYRWDTGDVCDVIAVPNSPVIGKRRIRTYPVEEAKGLVFVFVGDENAGPPALALDVPPLFLDPNMHVEATSFVVKSNWRVACENGFDGLHVYIHRESPLLPNTQRSLPLGHYGLVAEATIVEAEGGPKGLIDEYGKHESVYEGKVEGQVVVTGTKRHTGKSEERTKRSAGGSIWLPCSARVDGFPSFDTYQFEWYVPLDAGTHLYLIGIGKVCASEEERSSFSHEFRHRWKPVSIGQFNNQDIMAREASQKFYENDWSWIEEGLIKEDNMLVQWRELCQRHNRGIQLPKHLR